MAPQQVTSTLVAILASALLLSGCGAAASGPAQPAGAAPSASISAGRLLDPAAFASAMAEPERVTINVHVPFAGQIAGTDQMIPYDQIGAEATKLPADVQTPLAVYCRSGSMSSTAVRALAARGYTNIVELDGGMDAWAASGRPLLSNPPQ
ncbi:rhodanese-like domain-containing protein [Arthrobacter sp. CC3]|uniref:rhodanese-like domain-containing protein n=1 Tax=Arthrobacter sp. CC3 TaxID=3029185 RepID=UPI003264B0D3